MPLISVCLSPALLPLYDLQASIVVAIDIFRATTSICYGIANGARAIIPVMDVSECLSYEGRGYLLAAERRGKVVEGFHAGNSPFSYTREQVLGKTIVLTTTNGTKAIQMALGAKQILAGSFLHITALARYLATREENVVLVCAGWEDHVNLEDTVFAGALIAKLGHSYALEDDAAQIALQLYHDYKDDLYQRLSDSTHGQRMQRLGLDADIRFCLQQDTITAIPVMDGDRLVELKA
ncbi:2-phosphosulfolactate phosphatase [Olivibacter sitiensis]|uniref:2-phosphosulfolactate phosphatase n=1 Tax=Olivibacter sitiensis TaxID=376470 RepID=UPI00041E4DBD|nr:2-phosphosulfolactate phosphatase [Olivibacter sitiensis]